MEQQLPAFVVILPLDKQVEVGLGVLFVGTGVVFIVGNGVTIELSKQVQDDNP